ncbi:hypothetical protein [Aeromonas caviae]|uniref:hypothetical protein n=1 Tax=Aeromonas caviae TaxID=648 RepID=UPI002B47E103|nr:hypothetical protein [Aeromonas caviae]
MNDEQNEADEWHAIEEELRLIYGSDAFQHIIKDEWWKYNFCERRKKLEEQIKRQKIKVIKPLMFPSFSLTGRLWRNKIGKMDSAPGGC